MRSLVLIALLALCGLASAEISTRWFNQRLDHFNPIDRREWDMRYFANNEHYYAGGPLFIYISGGFEVYDDFIARGAMYELARDTNGYIFALEHRFFGESLPTENTSVENLAFLNIHQAAADIAMFIAFVKENYYQAANSRVILWGRGYGGALATWARQKYPNAVDAVWASSAPINAVLETREFMRNSAYTIRSIGGPECGSILEEAYQIMDDAVRLRNTTWIEDRLRLCSPIDLDIEEDVSRLFYGIAADIGYSFVSHARYPDIDEKCMIMRAMDTPDNPPANAVDAMARWFVDEFNRNYECLNYNNTAILARYQNVEWGTVSTIAGRRQNFWLQCTQLGQFATSGNGDGHPFGWRFDVSFFRRWCAEVFDEELFAGTFLEDSIARTNRLYGGLNPHVYRVFFTHGEMDPRRSLGPSEDLNENAPVVVMSLQSWGRDFGSPSEADYPILVQTKERARELMIKWLFDSIGEENTESPVSPLTEDPIPY